MSKGLGMNCQGFWQYFFALLILVTIFFVLLLPMIQLFNVSLWAGADPMIQEAASAADSMNDPGIKQAYLDSIDAHEESFETQIDILSLFNEYAWVAIVFIVVLGMFILTRQSVEAGIV